VLATTVWEDCCSKCCEDCQKDGCQKQRCDPCRCHKCGDECDDEDGDGEREV
jgi:hypothetical protein